MSQYISKRDYMQYKITILDELGMHDSDGLRAKLAPIVELAKTRRELECRLDRACRKLLMNFYDGDKTYAYGRGA